MRRQPPPAFAAAGRGRDDEADAGGRQAAQRTRRGRRHQDRRRAAHPPGRQEPGYGVGPGDGEQSLAVNEKQAAVGPSLGCRQDQRLAGGVPFGQGPGDHGIKGGQRGAGDPGELGQGLAGHGRAEPGEGGRRGQVLGLAAPGALQRSQHRVGKRGGERRCLRLKADGLQGRRERGEVAGLGERAEQQERQRGGDIRVGGRRQRCAAAGEAGAGWCWPAPRRHGERQRPVAGRGSAAGRSGRAVARGGRVGLGQRLGLTGGADAVGTPSAAAEASGRAGPADAGRPSQAVVETGCRIGGRARAGGSGG